MKKIAGLVLTVVMLVSVFAFSVNAGFDLADYKTGEVYVGYKDGTYEIIKKENKYALADFISDLLNNDEVEFFQPNYSYVPQAVETSDILINKQWALYNDGSFYMELTGLLPGFDQFLGQMQMGETVAGIDINAEEGFALYNGGTRDVVVAIVDMGINYEHEELTGRIWTNDDEIPDNGIDDDRNGYTDDYYGWNFYDRTKDVYTEDDAEEGHGTHCAGTIIAKSDNNVGIAGLVQSDRVKVMIAKALGGEEGNGTTESVVNAIRYAERNGAKICNLSLGTTKDDKALYNAIKNSNMLFIVAAGNDGHNADVAPEYPAAYDLDNIISVSNIAYNGKLSDTSNYGAETVDIAAPGACIISTADKNGYDYMSGSSMSAPFVTAAAAMLYSHHDNITLSDVKEIILQSARKLDTLDGTCVTGGMLDLGAALRYDINTLPKEKWDIPEPPKEEPTSPQEPVEEPATPPQDGPASTMPPQDPGDEPIFRIPKVEIGVPDLFSIDNLFEALMEILFSEIVNIFDLFSH